MIYITGDIHGDTTRVVRFAHASCEKGRTGTVS